VERILPSRGGLVMIFDDERDGNVLESVDWKRVRIACIFVFVFVPCSFCRLLCFRGSTFISFTVYSVLFFASSFPSPSHFIAGGCLPFCSLYHLFPD